MFRLIRGEDDGNAGPARGKIDKRAKALPTAQLTTWADLYLNEIGRATLAYNQQGDPRFLQEAEESTVALLALVRELRNRAL